MKTMVCMICFFLPGILFSQDSLSQSLGPNGGIIKKVENYYIEIKNVPEINFYAYLIDKELKIISNKNISCTAEFFYPDRASLKVQLRPVPGDAFMADVASGYNACEIVFGAFGTTILARFKHLSSVVRK